MITMMPVLLVATISFPHFLFEFLVAGA